MNIQCFFQFQNISPLLGNPLLPNLKLPRISKLCTAVTASYTLVCVTGLRGSERESKRQIEKDKESEGWAKDREGAK